MDRDGNKDYHEGLPEKEERKIIQWGRACVIIMIKLADVLIIWVT